MGPSYRVWSDKLYVSILCSRTRPVQASMLEIALVFAGESHVLQSTLPAVRTILSTLWPLGMVGSSERPIYRVGFCECMSNIKVWSNYVTDSAY